MKNILIKLIPSFIRSMIASAIMVEVRERIEKQALVSYAVNGVDWAIAKSTQNINDERMTAICNGCELGGETLRIVALACKPESDGGRKITSVERDDIAKNMTVALDMLISDDFIDSVSNVIGNRVCEYLGIKAIKFGA